MLQKAYEIITRMRWSLGLSAAASVLLLVGSVVGWLEDPLSGGMRGFQIPFFEKFGWISFGLLGILAFVAGVVSLLRKAVTLRVAAGIFAVWLSVFFVFHLAIADSRLLNSLVDSNNEYFDMMRFSAKYLPLNVGTEPSLVKLSRNTISDRLFAAWHFLDWGWYLVLAAGLVWALVPLPTGRLLARGGLFLGFLLISSILGIYPSLSARLHIARGDNYLYQGLYQNAIQEYGKACQWDGKVLLEMPIHHDVGMAYYYLNRVDETDCHIYLGDILADEKKREEAQYHYRKAMSQGSAEERAVAAKALSGLFIGEGLTAFDKSMKGDAIRAWEEASRIFPENESPLYFLSKAYFDVAMNHLAIDRGLQILRLSKSDILNSNICANLGDCYFSLRDYNHARVYYEKARNLDNYKNYRILKSLGGT